MPMGKPGELRIGMTISGAIALGAYEGGALAALLAGAQSVNEKQADALRVDAIAGASAGSMTALLAARTLVAGLDPVEVMYDAWVTAPQLQALNDGFRSPLSVDHMSVEVEKLLAGETQPTRVQPSAVQLNMALGCLRGLDYKIGRIGGPPIEANTYLDWAEFTVDASRPISWYTADSGPVAAALASGAHAVAFPPRLLDRSSPEVQQAYKDNGIEDFPPSGVLWYTDGGTIDNEPLGRALGMTELLDGPNASPLADAGRVHLLISPDPSPPIVGDDYWSRRLPEPTWTKTGLRALKLLRVQRLYDDLRAVEKMNSRITWTRRLEQTLVGLLEQAQPDPTRTLDEFSEAIKTQKEELTRPEDERVTSEQPTSELARAVRQALGVASGLAGKRDVSVAVISPLVLPEVVSGDKTPHQVLAGEFIGHFGGFLAQQLRENDFAYGYRSMICWMEGASGLAFHGLEPGLATRAVDGAAQARREWEKRAGRPWVQDQGDTSLGARPLKEKLAVLRVATRAAAIVFRQILSRHPG
ncbi:MAG: patatin-like phospholipase family protein [Solirubrobacteraceae bacterium]